MKKPLLLLSVICFSIVLSAQNISDRALLLKEEADMKLDSIDKMYTISQIGLDSLNENLIYDLLLQSFDNYIMSESLFRKSEESGINETTNIQAISKSLIAMRRYFINAGVYYYEKGDYEESLKYFDIYNSYPELIIFNDKEGAIFEDEDYSANMKWYQIVVSIQAGKHDKATELLKIAINDYSPYKEYPYKESDLYEYLAYEYKQIGNDKQYIDALNIGIDKFPDNQFFVLSLLNEYTLNGNYEQLNKIIDKFSSKKSQKNCELLSNVATQLTQNNIRKYNDAERFYKKALKQNKQCVQALMGIGVLYGLLAQDFENENSKKGNKKAISNYKKSINYLEECYKQSVEKQDKIRTLDYLYKIYYYALQLGMDTANDFERVERLKNRINNEK